MKNDMTKTEIIEYRITKLETSYDALDKKIDSLMNNHLPHLQRDIASLSAQVKLFTAINVFSIILGLIVVKFFS